MTPFFTDKEINNEKVLLLEEGETISDNKNISENLNNVLVDAVKNLNISQFEDPSVNTDHIEDVIHRKISKNHQSIKIIKGCFLNNSTFCWIKLLYLILGKNWKT